ncbi:MAG: hypothetical protein HYY16_17345, partial [Planctomycetes bacterium]|nr:hypothetical protein [Planctomycetota bacterium]
HLCCDIAVLNKRIEAARNEELKKQRSRTQVPARSPQAGDGNGRQR